MEEKLWYTQLLQGIMVNHDENYWYHDKDRVINHLVYMEVSENSGTPKSSILTRFSIINHPFWGTPIFGNTHI